MLLFACFLIAELRLRGRKKCLHYSKFANNYKTCPVARGLPLNVKNHKLRKLNSPEFRYKKTVHRFKKIASYICQFVTTE